MLISIEKHVPGVMTSLLTSSPPISISNQLFRCRYSNSENGCKLSFLFLPCRQSTPDSLLAGYDKALLGGVGVVGMYAPRLTFTYDHFVF